ncbi:RNA/RNP complex-1-interacting phosphatase isoform 2-T2 [Mantella aurantiaca]
MCGMALVLLGKFRVSVLCVPASCSFHLCSAAMKNRLPDGWTEYSAVGKRIPGTRFIAFKVPLKKLFDNKLAPWQRFSPTNLISEIEQQNEELGLIVDLTCTKRYYTPQELPPTVQYAKIFTAGQQVPTNDVIHEFKSIVKQFINENTDNDKLVGVHCTHGLNRTGYLVCRYMIDVLGMVPSEAIERFNKSRGHCIERKNYLDDLEGNNPESERSVLPKARHQQHIPSVNDNSGPDFRTPLCHHEQQWIPSHSHTNPSSRPRLSEPPFSQLSGPKRDFHQMSRRPPGFSHNSGPRIPPPVFPHPYMPESRSYIPQMEDNQQQHFSFSYNSGPRIPPPVFPHPYMPESRSYIPQMEDNQQQHFSRQQQRHRHHPKIHHAQQQDDRAVNGAPAPYIPRNYGGNMVNCTDLRSSGPQRHANNGPYRRYPGKSCRGTSEQQ